jgi:Uma2 family endonuclease
MFTIYDNENEEYQKVEEPDPSFSYTYADYMGWKFLERLELIRGRIFRLSAPSFNHAAVSVNLTVRLYNFLKPNPCFVFAAPFDVRLPPKGKTADNEIATVVQPDLGIICDHSKLEPRGCCGAPDLVIEVISPSNRAHDVRTKYELYEEAGASEYWIVDPENEKLFVYVLNKDGKYGKGKIYTGEDVITSSVVCGFSVKATDIFEDKIKIK